jgi:signal transduction histidine kinase
VRTRSLGTLLTRQWMLFATSVAVLFAAAGLLLLFLLEDSFIDRQLQAVARSVDGSAMDSTLLPAGFSAHAIDEVPLDIHARLPFATPGKPFEMRRADRRYVHVLQVDTATHGPMVVVYDVTDELTVTPRLGTGALIVLGLTLLTWAAAATVSRALVRRLTIQATRVAQDVRADSSPAQLRELARRQQIHEFQQLLCMHADIREAQLASVENERQTLAYLAHELRTPLQAAQTSLAQLAGQHGEAASYQRLQRAIVRLTRASRAALWLATDQAPADTGSALLQPLLQQTVTELTPLATQAGQTIVVDAPAALAVRCPAEVAETILANLLLNAIQHGAPGVISIDAGADSLTISNPVRAEPGSGGFGFGLEIVRRLAQRIDWTVEVETTGNLRITRVRMPSAATAAGPT